MTVVIIKITQTHKEKYPLTFYDICKCSVMHMHLDDPFQLSKPKQNNCNQNVPMCLHMHKCFFVNICQLYICVLGKNIKMRISHYHCTLFSWTPHPSPTISLPSLLTPSISNNLTAISPTPPSPTISLPSPQTPSSLTTSLPFPKTPSISNNLIAIPSPLNPPSPTISLQSPQPQSISNHLFAISPSPIHFQQSHCHLTIPNPSPTAVSLIKTKCQMLQQHTILCQDLQKNLRKNDHRSSTFIVTLD